jgi:hypothetical protein
MTKTHQLARPVMSAGARFHADQGGLKSGEKGQKLTARKSASNDCFAISVDAVNLEN